MGYTLKLISEHIEQDTDYLIEQDEKTGNKNYKIKGIFMQADIKNRNGRIYPMEVLQKEVKRYNKEYINQKRAFGELKSFIDNFTLEEIVTSNIGPETAAGKLLTKN